VEISRLKKALERWAPALVPYASDTKALSAALSEIIHKPLRPEEIERRSFVLLAKQASLERFRPLERPLVKRLLHATVDFTLPEELIFHPQAVEQALSNLRQGLDILTDVEMVRAGINKRKLATLGGKVHCYIADEEVFHLSRKTGRPRAEIAIEKGLKENIGLIVIGNAPTALIRAIDLLKAHPFREKIVIIGVPVGLVKAFEAKVYLALQEFPFITNLSPKGGSAMAVALVNALLGLLEQED